MKEIKLKSGSILKINDVPFSEAKSLYQAILEEAKSVQLLSSSEMGDIMKNIVCAGFSSKKIEAALSVCMARCLYNNLKIDEKTFEPMDVRGDYVEVSIEVVQEVISPFMKGLSAGLSRLSVMMPSILA